MKLIYQKFAFLLSLIILITFAGNLQATTKKHAKKKSKLADEYIKSHQYEQAAVILEEIVKAHPHNYKAKMKLGICYLEAPERHIDALNVFKDIFEHKPKTKNIYYYLGRAYQLDYKFDEAFYNYELHPQKVVLTTAQLNEMGWRMESCKVGKDLYANPKAYKIENAGDGINTKENEYAPLVPADESFIIYTYKGDKSIGGRQNEAHEPDDFGWHYEDVYKSTRTGNAWSEGSNLSPFINSQQHDAGISLSNDGNTLFIFRDNLETGGDIYSSKKTAEGWTPPVKLRGDINSKYWEGSASLSADGQTLYFASDRPNGSGGRDLYYATLQADSSWGGVTNMGAFINTWTDEDAPYIHPTNEIFIFSSKGHNTMGEYDIYVAYKADGTWGKIENMGYPINSPDNDKYYVISADGLHGYFSSERIGGKGHQDIYISSPGLLGFNKSELTVNIEAVKNLKPCIAAVVVTNNTDNSEIANTNTQNNGQFDVKLKALKTYSIKVKCDTLPEQTISIDLSNLNGNRDTLIKVLFGLTDTMPKIDSTALKTDSLQQKAAGPMKEITESQTIDVNSKSIIYTVQVAAFKIPENFKFNSIADLGKVEKIILNDGIARFSIGSFKTADEARSFRDKIIARGIKDAFVTAIKEGKRVMISELGN